LCLLSPGEGLFVPCEPLPSAANANAPPLLLLSWPTADGFPPHFPPFSFSPARSALSFPFFFFSRKAVYEKVSFPFYSLDLFPLRYSNSLSPPQKDGSHRAAPPFPFSPSSPLLFVCCDLAFLLLSPPPEPAGAGDVGTRLFPPPLDQFPLPSGHGIQTCA